MQRLLWLLMGRIPATYAIRMCVRFLTVHSRKDHDEVHRALHQNTSPKHYTKTLHQNTVHTCLFGQQPKPSSPQIPPFQDGQRFPGVQRNVLLTSYFIHRRPLQHLPHRLPAEQHTGNPPHHQHHRRLTNWRERTGSRRSGTGSARSR